MSRAASLAFLSLQANTAAASGVFSYIDTSQIDPNDFTVEEIYLRQDPTFIQGFYYDQDKRQLLESTGWYSESKTQWLELNESSDLVSPSPIMSKFPGD